MTSTRGPTGATVARWVAGAAEVAPILLAMAGTEKPVPEQPESAQTPSGVPVARRPVQKSKYQSGRVTPKGGPVGSRSGTPGAGAAGSSPTWVPVLMFSLLGIGVLIIFFNYVGWMPGGTSNGFLLLGLGSILAGIITATQYR